MNFANFDSFAKLVKIFDNMISMCVGKISKTGTRNNYTLDI